MRYWEIGLSQLLVIVDDIAIPIGQLRMRTDSSSGGHNGLKSIEEHLQTQNFARLRIGVGDRKEGDLASHVLGRFSSEEELLVPKILERAETAIEIWLEKGLNHAMDFANRPSNPSNGE
jgi:PTH1 family peptidyl-tRNA hydrolase